MKTENGILLFNFTIQFTLWQTAFQSFLQLKKKITGIIFGSHNCHHPLKQYSHISVKYKQQHNS